jgi:glycosyltransferase involved in cell wall biosynthesis
MSGRVLHILSQRPSRTGSGVTLEAMIRQAAAVGWRQAAVVGVPAGQHPRVGGLEPAAIHPVTFAAPDGPSGALDFLVPGMSDVMPYPSTVWSAMTDAQLDRYRSVWRAHLAEVIADFNPDVIHTHHIWLVSSLLKELAPDRPVVATCHSTGLRQLELTPHLAVEVRRGCARIDHFCVLRDDHDVLLRQILHVDSDRVTVIGAGYRPDLFRRDPRVTARPHDLLYIGKYSHAKGLPWLLDAFEQLRDHDPEFRLHIAGSGAGPEADALRERLNALAPQVVRHGQLGQPDLAALMQRCGVCVLPSFYEGVPLVLVEAAACGCRLVATDLPGVVERIAPHLSGQLDLVPLPRLAGSDRPMAADLPRFVADLTRTLAAASDRRAQDDGPAPAALAPFAWESVFAHVQDIWRRLIN